MSQIAADFTTLMRQASMTADEYLSAAIKSIDQRLGEGFAKKNPELIAAFMSAAATDFRTSITCKIGEDAMAELASAVSSVADALRAGGQS